MGLVHRASGVPLRATGRPTDHLGNEILEPRGRHSMVRFIHERVCIEPRVVHDTINQIVNDCCNAVHAAKAAVERRFLRCRYAVFYHRILPDQACEKTEYGNSPTTLAALEDAAPPASIG